jgi:tetratricopeptide (TPR) repeat protein
LQKAVSLSPTKQTIIAELVKNESYLGQYDQALALAEKEYNLDTSDTDAQSDYVAALVLNGKESTATQLFGASILTGNQSVTRSYLILASADLAKNDKTDALAEVNKAIAANATFKTQGQGIITGIQNGTVK